MGHWIRTLVGLREKCREITKASSFVFAGVCKGELRKKLVFLVVHLLVLH